MLRAFGTDWAMMERARAGERVRRALGALALAAVMAMLCRAGGGTTGFGMAFLSAAMMAGKGLAPLLIGCAAGMPGRGAGVIDLTLPAGAVVVLAGNLAWTAAGLFAEQRSERRNGATTRRRGAHRAGPKVQARSPTPFPRGSALAGAATLVPGLLSAQGAPGTSVAVLASALAAVCAEPFLESALAVRPGRRWLTGEERAGLALLAGLIICGLGTLSLPGAAATGAALAARLYPAGAAAGVGLGAGLLLSGGDGAIPALLGAGGLAAQLCGGSSRWVRGGASCAVLAVMAVLLKLPPPYIASAAAALAPLLLPAEWQSRAAGWAKPREAACDPDRIAALVRRDAAARLSALSAAFGELAEGYQSSGRTPDEGTLIARMRERLCDGCARYEACWTGETRGAAGFLCELAAQAVEWSAGDMAEPLFGAEATPALLRRCRRGRLIPERLGTLLEDFARARQAELKRGAENRLISAQFLQARRLLDGMADAMAAPVQLRGRAAARAMAALEAADIPVASVLALAGPRVELDVALREGCWSRITAAAAAARLEKTFGRAFAPEGSWGRELRFVRRPGLRAETGAACAARQADAPSGDSHIILELEGDRLLVLLCDGMGTGPAAAGESAAAVRLLARFMEAGADSALAVETVNALLLNRSGEDMFATVDMLVVELASGAATFTKLAACPTLIAQEGGLRRVQGGRLPLGILEHVQPARARALLAPGDVLAMLSDGVWEALGGDGVGGLLLAGETDMNILAERMLEAAQAAGGARDDMTAICLRLRAR